MGVVGRRATAAVECLLAAHRGWRPQDLILEAEYFFNERLNVLLRDLCGVLQVRVRACACMRRLRTRVPCRSHTPHDVRAG